MATAPLFHIVPGSAVNSIIDDNRKRVFDIVKAAYYLHAAGHTINPDSYFLRYPDKPSSRIIALPAHLGGNFQRSGIKWISSFPENISVNLARASAVLILNDATTGYPIACLESSLISATRTAASAALAAENLTPNPFQGTLGVIGTGIIARTTIEWLLFRNWKFDTINLYDLKQSEAEQLKKWLYDQHGLRAVIHDQFEDTISRSSLVLFTTTAGEPYVADEKLLHHAPTILHLSLRDICVDIILASQNIVDDVDHCLKASTSLHLAEIATGNRDFVSGVLFDVIEKTVVMDPKKTRIFSPFGLGVLDLAVGSLVLDAAISSNEAIEIANFFNNSVRW